MQRFLMTRRSVRFLLDFPSTSIQYRDDSLFSISVLGNICTMCVQQFLQNQRFSFKHVRNQPSAVDTCMSSKRVITTVLRDIYECKPHITTWLIIPMLALLDTTISTFIFVPLSLACLYLYASTGKLVPVLAPYYSITIAISKKCRTELVKIRTNVKLGNQLNLETRSMLGAY